MGTMILTAEAALDSAPGEREGTLEPASEGVQPQGCGWTGWLRCGATIAACAASAAGGPAAVLACVAAAAPSCVKCL